MWNIFSGPSGGVPGLSFSGTDPSVWPIRPPCLMEMRGKGRWASGHVTTGERRRVVTDGDVLECGTDALDTSLPLGPAVSLLGIHGDKTGMCAASYVSFTAKLWKPPNSWKRGKLSL